MAVTFAELGFRDIAGRLLVVACPLLERLDKAGIVVPGGADAVLAYAYVDHAQGAIPLRACACLSRRRRGLP